MRRTPHLLKKNTYIPKLIAAESEVLSYEINNDIVISLVLQIQLGSPDCFLLRSALFYHAVQKMMWTDQICTKLQNYPYIYIHALNRVCFIVVKYMILCFKADDCTRHSLSQLMMFTCYKHKHIYMHEKSTNHILKYKKGALNVAQSHPLCRMFRSIQGLISCVYNMLTLTCIHTQSHTVIHNLTQQYTILHSNTQSHTAIHNHTQ